MRTRAAVTALVTLSLGVVIAARATSGDRERGPTSAFARLAVAYELQTLHWKASESNPEIRALIDQASKDSVRGVCPQWKVEFVCLRQGISRLAESPGDAIPKDLVSRLRNSSKEMEAITAKSVGDGAGFVVALRAHESCVQCHRANTTLTAMDDLAFARVRFALQD